MFIPFNVIGDQCLPYRCINNTPGIDKKTLLFKILGCFPNQLLKFPYSAFLKGF